MKKLSLLLLFVACAPAAAPLPDPPTAAAPVNVPVPTPVPDPVPEPDPPEPEPTLQDKLQKALTKGIAAKKALAGATVHIRKNGVTLWSGAAGMANRATKEAATPAHSYRIASATKMFVATLVMQLVDEGKLALTDTVADHRPELTTVAALTIEQLLGHKTGLYDYQESADYQDRAQSEPTLPLRPDELIKFATDLGVKFPAGTSWAYSNTNYFILGLIVETLTGTTIDEAFAARIFTPLALHETFLAGENPSTLARGYDGAGKDVTDAYDPSFYWAAGAMVSTAPDLAVFLEALMTQKLTSAASLKTMTTPHTELGTLSDALGVFVEKTKLGDGVGHGGNYFGYLTSDYYFAKSGITIAALFNTDSVIDGKALEAEVVKALIGVLAAEP